MPDHDSIDRRLAELKSKAPSEEDTILAFLPIPWVGEVSAKVVAEYEQRTMQLSEESLGRFYDYEKGVRNQIIRSRTIAYVAGLAAGALLYFQN